MPKSRIALLVGAATVAGCIPKTTPPAPINEARAVRSPPAGRPAAPKVVDDTPRSASNYTVVNGDTLDRVAKRTGASAAAIAQANGLHPPFTIRSGQRIMIPARRWRDANQVTNVAAASIEGGHERP